MHSGRRVQTLSRRPNGLLDEVAELAGRDPIAFRLELLERAKKNPVGKNNDYDPDRYAGVLKLVRRSPDGQPSKPNVHRGWRLTSATTPM